MKINVDMKPRNCNHCIYLENVSRHYDLDDYCSKIMKRIGRIDMEKDCPLRKSRIQRHARKIIPALRNKRKMKHETEEMEHKAEDLTQMNTGIALTDKDGKFIEVRVPELEYMADSIW